MELLNIAAVVAEIEKIREHVKCLRYAVNANCIVTVRNTCECLESSIDLLVNSIDTLEVKEVDLEKELVDYHNDNFSSCNGGTLLSSETGSELTWYDYECIAKHFFELGFKATQKEK